MRLGKQNLQACELLPQKTVEYIGWYKNYNHSIKYDNFYKLSVLILNLIF